MPWKPDVPVPMALASQPTVALGGRSRMRKMSPSPTVGEEETVLVVLASEVFAPRATASPSSGGISEIMSSGWGAAGR